MGNLKALKTSDAYVLFYRRRDRLPPLPIANPLPTPPTTAPPSPSATIAAAATTLPVAV
jgi:hypothetical protein